MKIIPKNHRNLAVFAISVALMAAGLACGEIATFTDPNNKADDSSDLSDETSDALSMTDSEDTHLSELSLSPEAKDVLKRVKSYLTSLREERNALCGIDGSAHKALHEEVKSVLEDDALDEQQKRDRIKELHASFKDSKQAQRQAIDQCRELNGEKLALIKSKAEPVIKACLGEKDNGRHLLGKKARHHGRKGHHRGKASLRGEDRLEQRRIDIDSLQAMLLSDACSSALAGVEVAEPLAPEAEESSPTSESNVGE